MCAALALIAGERWPQRLERAHKRLQLFNECLIDLSFFRIRGLFMVLPPSPYCCG